MFENYEFLGLTNWANYADKSAPYMFVFVWGGGDVCVHVAADITYAISLS